MSNVAIEKRIPAEAAACLLSGVVLLVYSIVSYPLRQIRCIVLADHFILRIAADLSAAHLIIDKVTSACSNVPGIACSSK